VAISSLLRSFLGNSIDCIAITSGTLGYISGKRAAGIVRRSHPPHRADQGDHLLERELIIRYGSECRGEVLLFLGFEKWYNVVGRECAQDRGQSVRRDDPEAWLDWDSNAGNGEMTWFVGEDEKNTP
jgi:hypothetical protein